MMVLLSREINEKVSEKYTFILFHGNIKSKTLYFSSSQMVGFLYLPWPANKIEKKTLFSTEKSFHSILYYLFINMHL